MRGRAGYKVGIPYSPNTSFALTHTPLSPSMADGAVILYSPLPSSPLSHTHTPPLSDGAVMLSRVVRSCRSPLSLSLHHRLYLTRTVLLSRGARICMSPPSPPPCHRLYLTRTLLLSREARSWSCRCPVPGRVARWARRVHRSCPPRSRPAAAAASPPS